MRRSSRIALVIAFCCLLVATLVWAVSASRKAPPLTEQMVRAMFDRGKRGLEQKDVNAILALFSTDAKILQRSIDQIRPILEQAMDDLGAGSLTVTYDRLKLQQTSDGVLVSVDLEVSQRFKNADASYFRPRIRVLIQKERISRLFGIYSVEEWRIRHLQSDDNFDLRRI